MKAARLIAERHRLYAERAAKLRRRVALVTPHRVTNLTTRGDYSGEEVTAPAIRHGADDFLAIPSRFGDVLRYRDGREEPA